MEATIKVKERMESGSACARRMRRDGWVPGVIYGGSDAARSIALPAHEFEQMLHRHASEHMMIRIQIEGGAEESVLLKEVQHNPLTGGAVHVDLQKVAMNKSLRVEVPVELIGEAAGVKQGGVLEHLVHELEIECLPADIPEEIKVDVSVLGIGDMLTVGDISVAGGKIKILADDEIGVAMVAAPKTTDETAEEAEEGAVAEPEVIKEKKDEDAD